jgi:hypothetical protein
VAEVLGDATRAVPDDDRIAELRLLDLAQHRPMCPSRDRLRVERDRRREEPPEPYRRRRVESRPEHARVRVASPVGEQDRQGARECVETELEVRVVQRPFEMRESAAADEGAQMLAVELLPEGRRPIQRVGTIELREHRRELRWPLARVARQVRWGQDVRFRNHPSGK